VEKIRVVGLTRLDALELAADHPDAEVTFEESEPQDAQHGELATAALIALTVAGLQVLAAWLVKDRKKGRVEHTIEIVSPTGERRTEKLVVDLSESTAQAQVLQELGRLTKVDVSAFEEPAG
jgi:hypothetical protein